MVDEVSRALCEAAGRSHNGEGSACGCCERFPDGRVVCVYWETFRAEAKVAILAAYKWNRRERRWPGFVKET